MSCYFRHMKDVFAEAGVEITKENKKDIDRAIHRIAGIEYKDCSTTWRTLKDKFLGDDKKRAVFVKKLKKAVG
ncbi:MAG: hypothetical protein PVF95_08680 [bacterium]